MDTSSTRNQEDPRYLRIDRKTDRKLFKILRILESGCWDEESLKRKTELNKQELELSLTILKLHGYLEEIKKTSNCTSCLAIGQCTSSQKIYKITEKGRKILKEITK